jgi:hypothetical protein
VPVLLLDDQPERMSASAPKAAAPRAATRHRLATLLAVVFGLLIVASAITPGFFTVGDHPHGALDPTEVVSIQLSALRVNEEDDEGIAVAFRFASPQNRANTGPVTRFASLLKSADYLPLLNHIEASLGNAWGHHGSRFIPVVVTDSFGNSSAFVWVLSRQTDGQCHHCWMTDRVIPLGRLSSIKFA